MVHSTGTGSLIGVPLRKISEIHSLHTLHLELLELSTSHSIEHKDLQFKEMNVYISPVRSPISWPE